MPYTDPAKKRAYQRAYYQANKQRSVERGREWYARKSADGQFRKRHRERVARWRAANLERHQANQRQRYAENRELRREQNARWYRANRERHQLLGNVWRGANADRVRAAARDWYRANPESVREKRERTSGTKNNRQRLYYQKNRERLDAKSKSWAKANPARRRKHHARQKNKITDETWDKLRVAVAQLKRDPAERKKAKSK